MPQINEVMIQMYTSPDEFLVARANAGEIPTASYSDAASGQVYFSATGYLIVGNAVAAAISAKGW